MRLITLSILTTLLTASLAQAGSPNPFGEGTQTVVLSAQEKESLLQYADNSKARLEKALKHAQGLPFEQARSVYLAAIKKIVIDSYESKPRSELLMRYALNQGLELTTGVPTADGKGFVKQGVLSGAMNQDAQDLILIDSIKLALHYYQDDRLAIQSGKLMELPYVALAQDRLELGRFKWLPAVIEWRYQYDLSVALLKQWLATVGNEEERRKVVFAEELTEANEWFESERSAPSESKELKQRTRTFRKKLRELSERMKTKLGSLSLIEKQVVKNASTLSDMKVHYSLKKSKNKFGMEFAALPNGIEMQTTETTQDQYYNLMETIPSEYRDCPNGFVKAEYFMLNGRSGYCTGYPVEYVTLTQAQDFISELNKKTSDGYEYRLPTRDEWEFAARGGVTTRFVHGDDETLSQLSKYSWNSSNSGGHPQPVGRLAANSFGLFDMLGNVSEMTIDPDNEFRAMGMFFSNANIYSYFSVPMPFERNQQLNIVGFRVVRVKK